MSVATLNPEMGLSSRRSPDSGITIERHALDDSDRGHLSAWYWRWCELFDRDPLARITQHPDYVMAEVPAAAPSPPLMLCAASRGEQFVTLGVLAPKSLTLRPAGRFGPAIRRSGYRLIGNRLLGDQGTDLQRTVLAACDTLVREQQADFLLIEDLEQTDDLFAAVRSLPHADTRIFTPAGWQTRWKIDFPPRPQDYWSKFSSKTRNTFKRKQKRIGAARLLRVAEPVQVADFLETAHEISLRTWQSAKLGLRVRNDETEARLFTLLATHGALRSYLLFVDDRPAAFLIGTQFRGAFSYEEVGYVGDLAELSPGQVLLLHVLEDLVHNNPPTVFDFGGGDADYKRLFATTQSTSGNVLLMPSGWRSQAALAWWRSLRWCDRTARRVVQRLGLTTRLRQILRGKQARLSTCQESGGDS